MHFLLCLLPAGTLSELHRCCDPRRMAWTLVAKESCPQTLRCSCKHDGLLWDLRSDLCAVCWIHNLSVIYLLQESNFNRANKYSHLRISQENYVNVLLLGNKNFQIWNILQWHAVYNNFYKGWNILTTISIHEFVTNMYNFHTILIKNPSYSLVLFSSCKYTSLCGPQTLLTVNPNIIFFALWVIFYIVLVYLSSFTRRHGLVVPLHPNYEMHCSVFCSKISRDLPFFHEHFNIAPEIGHYRFFSGRFQFCWQ
jgi:hypothetical protein